MGLYPRWTLANALGELFGLGITFTIGIGATSLIGEPQNIVVAVSLGLLMVAAGGIEGGIVGSAQWWAMHESFPAIKYKSWVAATTIGALVAWTLGSIPTMMVSMNSDPTNTPIEEPDVFMILMMAALMGALLGIILALAQWLVLRKHVRNAWWWLPANSIAWLVGMPIIFAAVDQAQKVDNLAQVLFIFAAAFFLTGGVVGMLHGIALVKLSREEIS